MVRVLSIFFVLFTVSVFAQQVVVTSEIEVRGNVGMPLEGTITITHDQSDTVDTNSFLLGKGPLEVDFLKEVLVAPDSPLTISIYNFTIEPQEPGLHELPEISVSVGGKVYRSFSSTYEVEEEKKLPQSADSSIILRIEPLIVGDTPLYPGQRIKVGYRYIFNYSHELSREELPLLKAKGFSKVGGKEAETKVNGKLIHYDVLQEVEAVEPGTFDFPPAKIQGRAWKKEKFGQKNFAKRDSTAQSAAISIEVLPFPLEGKPPSFNGAIGEDLSFEVKLLTPNKVTVGDKMVLQISIEGNGELATLPIPEVCCQPGYSGFFRTSDLPPQEDLFGSTKTFRVEMRPLNDKIKELPPLEFSYFNPKEKMYTAIASKPIPLTVTPLPSRPIEEGQQRAFDPQEQQAQEERIPAPKAIEIEGNFDLVEEDLENKWFGVWWVLLVIPLGLGSRSFSILFTRSIVIMH